MSDHSPAHDAADESAAARIARIDAPGRPTFNDPATGVPVDRRTVIGMAAGYANLHADSEGWFECRRIRISRRGTARALRAILEELVAEGLMETGRSFYGRRRWRVRPELVADVKEALARPRVFPRRDARTHRIPPVAG